jgi:hypothetical protein
MKTTKVAPGIYDVDTVIGTFEVCSKTPVENRGYGKATMWFLTWPNRSTADAVFATKREAIEAIKAELAA